MADKLYNVSPIKVPVVDVEICCLKEELGEGKEITSLDGETIKAGIKVSVDKNGYEYVVKQAVLDDAAVAGSSAQVLVQAIVDAHNAQLAVDKMKWKEDMSKHDCSDMMEMLLNDIEANDASRYTGLEQALKDSHASKKILRASEPS